MEHSLGITVIETNNPQVLHLIDESIYNEDVPYVCPRIHITVPGFQTSSETVPTQNFNLVLTACNLEIQTTRCDSQFFEIPDGVYAIRYSVSPNEYVFTEINHLRLTKTNNRIAKIYCSLEPWYADLPKKQEDKLKKLNEVENLLKAAVASIEVCKDFKKGTELYNYALKKLDKIDCKHC